MGTVRARFESKLPRPAGELWNWSTSARGVHKEMAPLLTLDFPAGMTHIPQDSASLGKPLGNCRFRLFGVLPVDLSRLTFVEIEPGRRFVEQSPLLSMKAWRHERLLEPCEDGTRVIDTLEYTPRFGTRLTSYFIGRFFEHRHAVLRREFAERRSVDRSVARPVASPVARSVTGSGEQRAERVDVQPSESA